MVQVSEYPLCIYVAIPKGKAKTILVTIKNEDQGKLSYRVTSRNLSQTVLINEVYIGRTQKYPMNGIELYNNGPDLSIHGWKLEWFDNASTSSSYTFPPYIFKSGKTIVVSKKN